MASKNAPYPFDISIFIMNIAAWTCVVFFARRQIFRSIPLFESCHVLILCFIVDRSAFDIITIFIWRIIVCTADCDCILLNFFPNGSHFKNRQMNSRSKFFTEFRISCAFLSIFLFPVFFILSFLFLLLGNVHFSHSRLTFYQEWVTILLVLLEFKTHNLFSLLE